DDENTMFWTVYWNPAGPLEGNPQGTGNPSRTPIFGEDPGYLPHSSDWLGAWRYRANKTNDYLLDREAQRTSRFCGVPTISMQDQAMTESMGVIRDRTGEHLGTTDAGIIRA